MTRITRYGRIKPGNTQWAPGVKSEPKQEQLDDIEPTYSLSAPRDFGWKELDYLDASSWSKDDITKHLITNSFSFPGTHAPFEMGDHHVGGRLDDRSSECQFMWSSLRLVLGDEKEWDKFKTGILYVSRLCQAFLGEARRAMSEEGIGRSWRCTTFDKALTRYRMGWLLSEPKYLKDFWEMYGDDQYQKDPVKFDWKRLVARGIKGFKVEEGQVEGGIVATEWMDGLKELRGDWLWDKSTNTPFLVKPQSKLDACYPPTPLIHNCVSVAFTPSTPSSELFKLLYEKFLSQDQHISLLEKEVSMFRTAQADHPPVVVSDTIPIFVPTPNFPEISDPDCTAEFWRNPLEWVFDIDMDEAGSSIKADSDVKMQVKFPLRLQEETGSAPVKSLQKLQRMED
ncbi:hypothetical protein EV421DRAFT_1993966 [Armillaria borealis]|uniref:Uncharacterized protein n=1 Tax=Armillaria borealis TaxID=47425 RepID=A0AA39J1Q8_9AGAR|nr:hypothetical protein EV421DRAFT_1993966 [Armillaria borealis]